ncbi:MAG: hypothetical protein U1A77_11530 [Pirellulales bacterium]
MHGSRRPPARRTGPPAAPQAPADEQKPKAPAVRPSVPSLMPRFSLGGMMLVTFVFCCIASGGYYLARSLQGGQNSRLAFTLFTLASPVVIMVLVSLVYHLARGGRRRR